VPDISTLSWDAVMEFRSHPAVRSARDELWDLGQLHGSGDQRDLAIAIEKQLRLAERKTLGSLQQKQAGARVILSTLPHVPVVSGIVTEAVTS
jgi:hypothetical protein